MALRACLDTRFYSAYYASDMATAPWTRRVVEAARLPRSQLVSSTITISELLCTMPPEVGRESVRLRVSSAKHAGIEFVAVSEEIADKAGEILLRVADLPMADAIVAATAVLETDGRVYTDDEHFRKIPGVQTVWGRA